MSAAKLDSKNFTTEQATLFMTLMEYLISQAGAFQVLVYESSKQNLN